MKQFFSDREVKVIRHEFRTCLNQIQGYRDLIHDAGAKGGEEQEAWLVEIDQEGERLLQLIMRYLREGEPAGPEVFSELADATRGGRDVIHGRATALREYLLQSGAATAGADAGKILTAIDRWDSTLARLLTLAGGSC